MALGLLLIGCGPAVHASHGQSGPPRAAGPVTVTNQDLGHTVKVERGRRIDVFFTAEAGQRLGEITSTDPRVLAPRVDPKATAVRGARLASFQAMRTGRADVTVSRSAACSPGTACPQEVQLLIVHVLVTAG